MKTIKTTQLPILLFIFFFSCCNNNSNKKCSDYYAREISNQIIVDFDDCEFESNPEKIKDAIQKLQQKGFQLNDTCRCDPTLILFDDIESVSVNPEERLETAKDQIRPEGLGNAIFNLEIQLPSVPKYRQMKFSSDQVKLQKQITVAVIDGGLSPDIFTDYLWEKPEGKCGDDYGLDLTVDGTFSNHANLVGRLIADGIDPESVKLMDINIFDSLGRGDLFNASCGMSYAIQNNADFINTSWGYYNDKYDPMLFAQIKKASENGIIIVSSAGNNCLNTDLCGHFPSGFSSKNYYNEADNVVSVAYLNENSDALNSHSNFGKKSVSLAATGILNISTEDIEGSSFATPLVTKAVVEIKGTKITYNHHQIIDCLFQNIDDINIEVATEGKIKEPLTNIGCQ